jgi:nicotinamide-nucleotide amidase
MDDELRAVATRALGACRVRNLTIATVESCTGGLVAATLTDIPGSSDVFDRGFVTYSNEAKQEMLGITPAMLAAHGAVSRETAEAMAKGALAHSHADLAVATTGIAGPDGGTASKPVGLVYFAAASRDGHVMHSEKRYGEIGRIAIRHKSVGEALALVANLAITQE